MILYNKTNLLYLPAYLLFTHAIQNAAANTGLCAGAICKGTTRNSAIQLNEKHLY